MILIRSAGLRTIMELHLPMTVHEWKSLFNSLLGVSLELDPLFPSNTGKVLFPFSLFCLSESSAEPKY